MFIAVNFKYPFLLPNLTGAHFCSLVGRFFGFTLLSFGFVIGLIVFLVGGTGLTEFERKGGKDTYKQIGTNKNDGYILHGKDVPLKEGPSYEYANYMKKIEKAENIQAKEVNNLVKLLTKKGLKKEATFLAGAYMKSMGEFDKYLKTLYGKLT